MKVDLVSFACPGCGVSFVSTEWKEGRKEESTSAI